MKRVGGAGGGGGGRGEGEGKWLNDRKNRVNSRFSLKRDGALYAWRKRSIKMGVIYKWLSTNKGEKFEYDYHILPRKSRHSRVAKCVAIISEGYYFRRRVFHVMAFISQITANNFFTLFPPNILISLPVCMRPFYPPDTVLQNTSNHESPIPRLSIWADALFRQKKTTPM